MGGLWASTQSSAKCKCVEQLKIPRNSTKGKLRAIKAGQQQLQVPEIPFPDPFPSSQIPHLMRFYTLYSPHSRLVLHLLRLLKAAKRGSARERNKLKSHKMIFISFCCRISSLAGGIIATKSGSRSTSWHRSWPGRSSVDLLFIWNLYAKSVGIAQRGPGPESRAREPGSSLFTQLFAAFMELKLWLLAGKWKCASVVAF